MFGLDRKVHSPNLRLFRPTHWDQRGLADPHKRRLRSVDTFTKRNKAAMLSTFTQPMASETRLQGSRKHFTLTIGQQQSNFTSFHCQDPIVEDSEQEKAKEPSRNHFATAFMPVLSSPPSNANIGISTSPILQSPLDARGKKSKAMFSGRLCKRLQSIRDTTRGDKIRFQSGQYPFSVMSVDMNDPRNRATSVVDVTLLETSYQSNREGHKVLMLGFVHHATGSLSNLVSQYSWICFSCDTAREQVMTNGTQLRVYNAVSMGLSKPLFGSHASHLPTIEWLILATTLCEPYPNELPKLPDVPPFHI